MLETGQTMQDAGFLYRQVCSTIKSENPLMAMSLSLLWKYVIITVDQCLYTNEGRYGALKNKFDENVAPGFFIVLKIVD